MKTKPVKETQEKTKSWVVPGIKLTRKEFIAGIREAEKGPFYTFEELQATRKQWRKQKRSL
jgi:hypothetical protein